MIWISDFRTENGEIDWAAYRRAKAAYRRAKDTETRQFMHKDSREIDHDSYIRCPACGHLQQVDGDLGHLFEEGEHEVFCDSCDHEFIVSTTVTFTFTSPAMGIDEDDEE